MSSHFFAPQPPHLCAEGVPLTQGSKVILWPAIPGQNYGQSLPSCEDKSVCVCCLCINMHVCTCAHTHTRPHLSDEAQYSVLGTSCSKTSLLLTAAKRWELFLSFSFSKWKNCNYCSELGRTQTTPPAQCTHSNWVLWLRVHARYLETLRFWVHTSGAVFVNMPSC